LNTGSRTARAAANDQHIGNKTFLCATVHAQEASKNDIKKSNHAMKARSLDALDKWFVHWKNIVTL
jgi:hypothetical protein